jgi:hypothetical protein
VEDVGVYRFGGASYTVYTALLTQAGTSAPTATVLQNTLGGTVVWARSGAGVYTGTLSGAFPASKTAIFISNNDAAGSDSMNQYSLRRTSADVVTINTLSANWAGTEAPFDDGLLNGTTVEIRVYP